MKPSHCKDWSIFCSPAFPGFSLLDSNPNMGSGLPWLLLSWRSLQILDSNFYHPTSNESIKSTDQTLGISSLIGKCFQWEDIINNKFIFLGFHLFSDIVLKVFIWSLIFSSKVIYSFVLFIYFVWFDCSIFLAFLSRRIGSNYLVFNYYR